MGLDDYKIIKKIGKGFSGTTYLVKKSGKSYALKIEKILESDIKKSLRIKHWREIEFCKKFANKHPEHFMTLYDYDITGSYDYKWDIDIEMMKRDEKIKKLYESKYCSRKIYSLVDTTLQKYLPKLKIREQIYSVAIQMSYIIYLLHKDGYTHNDMHLGNIGVTFTKKKSIKIFEKNIPTFGIILQLIDYGIVKHNKFNLSSKKFIKNIADSEINTYKHNMKFEIMYTLSNIFIDDYHFYKQLGDICPNFDIIPNKAMEFEKTDESKFIKSFAKTSNMFEVFRLYMVLHPSKYLKFLLGDKYKPLEIKYLLSPDDVIYLYSNLPIEKSDDIKKIIDYFMLKL